MKHANTLTLVLRWNRYDITTEEERSSCLIYSTGKLGGVSSGVVVGGGIPFDRGADIYFGEGTTRAFNLWDVSTGSRDVARVCD